MKRRLRSNLEPGSPHAAERREHDAAGAAQPLLKQLARSLRVDAITVTGRTPHANRAAAGARDSDLLRPLSRPFSDARRESNRWGEFSGPVLVFEHGTAALAAIRAAHVKPGHALIVRGMGHRRIPRMAEPAAMVVFALDGAGLEQDAACVTDGQLSGLLIQQRNP